jgi:V/A-type H+-transporting ATPase subunit I
MLHGVNFVMGCFSPVIQALRLHYVEFFGKFYQDGGRPYEPFSLAS